MEVPLLEVRGLTREFVSGGGTVAALRDIDLRIEAGEMIAIMGPSGSGKSTLMNILGCLDRPTRGTYAISGLNASELSPDSLAQLRREHFGFVFQRYHLLGDLDALANVEIPAIYAGIASEVRRVRARDLLHRLGMSEHLRHRPGQLSGGQQQRVSIARALMNGGDVILADEPTGALDRTSGEEMMKILASLHAEGHTIVLVTHDADVASHAQRIIELSDGRIVADRRRSDAPVARLERALADRTTGAVRAEIARLAEATRMAWRSMVHNRLRTLLTMLGIVIGIASVVLVVALGAGASQRVLDNFNALGTNTLAVYPGTGFGDQRASAVRLQPADAEALSQLGYVDSATPEVGTSSSLRYRNTNVGASVTGVGALFFRVRGYRILAGRVFDSESVRRQSQEAVIDENARNALFPNGGDPLGAVILLGDMPARVVGVVSGPAISPGGGGDQLNVWLPYTTVLGRMTGQDRLKSIAVRVRDGVAMAAAEQGIKKLLTQRYAHADFFVVNSDSIRESVEQTSQTLTLLVSSIALIALVVGGIGVMNIMLVSIAERTQEIGVRMAVGARQSDILHQFLIEAVLVCLLGGGIGVALALGAGMAFALAADAFMVVFSTTAMVAAFGSSTLIGIVFGYLPARNAARLDPVDALSRP